MTPNLRFNKNITKTLIKSIPEEKLTLQALNWRLDNTRKVYGSYHKGLFKTTMFLLQRIDEDMYRLLTVNNKNECRCYLIEDIKLYMKVIGIEEIDLVDTEDIYEALEDTKVLPNTGIIVIDEEESVFVYDHENY